MTEDLKSERNMFKGKYRAMLKLIGRARDQLVQVTDSIEDEGDRKYFGSTNDADALLDLYHEMMSWVWDATDKTNQMKSDPYADLRDCRDALAAKDAEIKRLREALDLRVKPLVWDGNRAETPLGIYYVGRIGNDWTVKRGHTHAGDFYALAAGTAADFDAALIEGKVAAKVDYEDRILSALSIPDPAGGMPVEVE